MPTNEVAGMTATTTTAQGRRGRPVPPPPIQSFAVVYETPAGLGLIEVEARHQNEAIESAFRLNTIDENAVRNARVFDTASLFRPVDDVLAGREVQT